MKAFFGIIVAALVLSGCAAQTEPEPAPKVEERKSAITQMDCFEAEKYIRTVRFTISESGNTPAEVMINLDYHADAFASLAINYSGSEASWLLKMSELSGSLSEWLDTGAGDGDLIFDQLNNNFGLVNQFC
jgi:hypothetical protein